MTPTKVRPLEVSDLQILAALDRAARHNRTDSVPGFRLAEHLGLRHGTSTTRHLRPQIEKLTEAGQLVRTRRHGNSALSLTNKGRRRLARARRERRNLDLPESPQHRRWRTVQDEASNRINEFRNELGTTLTATRKLLRPGEQDFKAALEVLTRLRGQCDRLAWAMYCLYEWAEPDDAHADIDISTRQREVHLVGVNLTGGALSQC